MGGEGGGGRGRAWWMRGGVGGGSGGGNGWGEGEGGGGRGQLSETNLSENRARYCHVTPVVWNHFSLNQGTSLHTHTHTHVHTQTHTHTKNKWGVIETVRERAKLAIKSSSTSNLFE